jgi:hypothetical protein
MTLEKKNSIDYEIKGEFRFIQERVKTSIMEDDKELSFSYHRRTIAPDADMSEESNESDEIKALAAALWTDEIKAAYEETIPSAPLEIEE